MATQYTITLYKNSGFNHFDSPATAAVLNQIANSEALTGRYWKRADIDLTYIKLACEYSQVKNTDYMAMNDGTNTTYFFVNGVTMLSNGTCLFDIEIDALLTMGGAESLEWDGWATRAHSKSDELFENNTEEPFSQLEPWDFSSTHGIIGERSDSNINVVGSTIELDGNDGIYYKKIAAVYEASVTGEKVAIPSTIPATRNTRFKMADAMTEYNKNLVYPIMTFYDADEMVVKESIAAARDIGAEASIIYSYSIPADYVDVLYDATLTRSFSELKGKIKTQNPGIPFIWDNNIKNKKVFSGQFSIYVLVCPAAGTKSEYKADVINDGGESPAFLYFTDPSPDGRPYFRPRAYQGNTSNFFLQAVPGCSWQNLPIAYERVSANEIDLANLQLSQNAENQIVAERRKTEDETIALGKAASLLSATMRGGIGTASLIGEVAETATEGIQREIRRQGEDIARGIRQELEIVKHDIRVRTSPIEMRYPMSGGIQNYGGNVAYLYHMHISTQDARRLDDYFSAYGYATNERLTGYLFTGRQNHNYVRGNARCISEGWPLRLREKASQAIANGVRVWHVKPSIAALYTNPIS